MGWTNLRPYKVGIVNRIKKFPEKGTSMTATGTAWVLSKGYLPIIYSGSTESVDQFFQLVNVRLTDEELGPLKEHY